jgi:hypothetical protein
MSAPIISPHDMTALIGQANAARELYRQAYLELRAACETATNCGEQFIEYECWQAIGKADALARQAELVKAGEP